MAYWFRKRDKHVYFCVIQDGKPKSIPRAETKHMDVWSDRQLDAEAERLEREVEGKTVTKANLLLDGTELGRWLEDHLKFLRGRKKDANTVGWRSKALRERVIPFFLQGKQPLHDPASWPERSAQLLGHLEARGVSYDNILRANMALTGFYRWLREERHIRTNLEMLVRNPVKDEDDAEEAGTPLRHVVTPDQMLSWLRGLPTDDNHRPIKLLALFGYFLSLRPQETFALKPADFGAGSNVIDLECAVVMKRANLFSKLVVDVQRQRAARGAKIKPPKAHSRGKVACFNEEAAKMIVGLLKGHNKDKPLFERSNGFLFKQWKACGYPEATLKDLRRASLYWLGHHTTLEPANLQKHARHKYLSTTMLYMRRPGEQSADEWNGLDLDA